MKFAKRNYTFDHHQLCNQKNTETSEHQVFDSQKHPHTTYIYTFRVCRLYFAFLFGLKFRISLAKVAVFCAFCVFPFFSFYSVHALWCISHMTVMQCSYLLSGPPEHQVLEISSSSAVSAAGRSRELSCVLIRALCYELLLTIYLSRLRLV